MQKKAYVWFCLCWLSLFCCALYGRSATNNFAEPPLSHKDSMQLMLRAAFDTHTTTWGDTSIQPLRLLGERGMTDPYLEQNNSGIANKAEADLKAAAMALVAAIPATVAANFKVYDYTAYSLIGRMENAEFWNEWAFGAMDSIIRTQYNVQHYLLIAKEINPADGKVKFRIKFGMPTVTTPPPGSTNLWDRLTPENIKEIETTSLSFLKEYDSITSQNGSLKLLKALVDNFKSITKGWLSEYELRLDNNFGRSGEKLGLSPDGRIIKEKPKKDKKYVVHVIPGWNDTNSPKLFTIVGFNIYEDASSKKAIAEYTWENGKYINKISATDELAVDYESTDAGPVYIYQVLDNCQYRKAGIEWTPVHKAAYATTPNYISTTFTQSPSNDFWKNDRLYHGQCPDEIKKADGTVTGISLSYINSSDYEAFRDDFHQYVLANVGDTNEAVIGTNNQNPAYGTKRIFMVVYADRYANNTRLAGETESPKEAINRLIDAYKLNKDEALFVIAYNKDGITIVDKVKIVELRLNENRMMVSIVNRNDTKFGASNLSELFELPFKAVIEIADLMSRGIEHLKFSDKWWKDCHPNTQWYGVFLEYVGIGFVMKPYMDTPEFKALTGYDPKVTSTFKVQVAFMCGAWNGVVDIVKSIPELIKLLASLGTGEAQDKVGKGYNSLKESVIYEADGTTPSSCGNGKFFCKLWPTIQHGIVAMLGQLNTPCDKANFAGQIIGPLATLLLPVPKVPPGGAQSLKAIEVVINALKWCDDAGDVFSVLGKSVKFIKQETGGVLDKLNIEIKFGTKYQLDVKDGKHYIMEDGVPVKNLDGTPKEFDSADDAFNAVKKTIDAFLSNLKGFNKLAAPYQMAYQNAFATMSTKSKTILSELSEAVNKNITNASDFKVGFFDDFVKLIDPKIVDRADLDKCISRFGCFAAGTSVRTSAGWFPIETLHEGDKLLAYNHNTKHVEEQIIEKTTHHTVDILQKVTLSNDEVILTTPNHLFYLRDKYVPAAELQLNDTLLSSDDKMSIFIKSTEALDSTLEVYNFTVANCLNYFVGRSSVLVHNDHGTGVLGKMSAALRIQVTSLDALQEGLSARMLDYIEQFGGDKILMDLLDTKKFDELTDRLKRTAQSVNVRSLRNDVDVLQGEKPELTIGVFSDLSKKNTAGKNNLTAHHIPSHAFMDKNKIYGYKHSGGICILVESSIKSGEVNPFRHGRTKTFGSNMNNVERTTYENLTPKQALDFDINDLRNIYISDGVYNASVEKALQNLIQQTKNTYPGIF